MKTLQNLFTAVMLIAVAAFVGCADSKTPDDAGTTPPADHADHDENHTHDQEGGTPTPTEPRNDDGPELPTPDENPDVDPADDAESGSVDRKGGVDIRE
jgi:hypothetical protein